MKYRCTKMASITLNKLLLYKNNYDLKKDIYINIKSIVELENKISKSEQAIIIINK